MCSNNYLEQWFSTRGDFVPPKGTCGNIWRQFLVLQLGLLASGRQTRDIAKKSYNAQDYPSQQRMCLVLNDNAEKNNNPDVKPTVVHVGQS